MQDESKDKSTVGPTLKRLRTKRKLSLRELGSRVQLSATFLSRIERGHVQPSLGTLTCLARFFGYPIGFFFAEEFLHPQYRITKDRDRHIVYSDDQRIGIEFLTDYLYGNPRMEVMILTLKPKTGRGSSPYTHAGEEVIHVLQGEAGIQLGEREVVLKAGDTVTLDPRLAHDMRNAGEGETKVLVAMAPPNPRLP